MAAYLLPRSRSSPTTILSLSRLTSERLLDLPLSWMTSERGCWIGRWWGKGRLYQPRHLHLLILLATKPQFAHGIVLDNQLTTERREWQWLLHGVEQTALINIKIGKSMGIHGVREFALVVEQKKVDGIRSLRG